MPITAHDSRYVHDSSRFTMIPATLQAPKIVDVSCVLCLVTQYLDLVVIFVVRLSSA